MAGNREGTDAMGSGASSSDAASGGARPRRLEKSPEQWRSELTPEEFRVTREAGTERAWGQAYEEWKKEGEGVYSCTCCGAELFSSKEKFDARCGWPAFYDPSQAKNVKTRKDVSLGMERVEVLCAVCDAHLGHVFTGEGFDTPTDKRYCINAIALDFKPKKGEADPR